MLQAYIPSIGRGNNIIKAINEIDPSMIFNIRKTDAEVTFEFKFVDSDKIIPLLKPRTSGAGISLIVQGTYRKAPILFQTKI